MMGEDIDVARHGQSGGGDHHPGGDRIDGGAINSIGNGKITYVKGGRTYNLPILNGR